MNSIAGTTGNERVLALPGLFNVRDLGGLPADGGQVKWGLLYRSGDLGYLTGETRAELEARNIKTIVDFRDTRERDAMPDGEIATVQNRCDLSISAGSIVDFYEVLNVADAENMMEELYRKMPAAATLQYRAFFALLQAQKNLPLLFHCSAGKDRTGIAAALILSALGVDRNIIIDDYLLSAEGLRGKYDDFIARNPASEPFMTVRRNFIEAALNAIDGGPGGMDRYLREDLGADVKTLKNLYIEFGGSNAGSF
jgi:protein-tyrosine phosphatase